MHKHRGGGWLDSMKKQAADLHASASKSVADMDLSGKAQAAKAKAISTATSAGQMVSDAHGKAMAAGADIHAQMKPHLDMAGSHASDLMRHAQNGDAASFKASMGNFSSSMASAASAGSSHALNNTKVGNASLADHASAMGNKVSSAASDLHKNAMDFFSGLTGKSDNAAPPAAAGGRRRRRTRKARKSRKHPKKGQRSRTMKGRKDFTTKKGNKYYNRRGHRQTKNAKGKRGRPYRTRKARKH